MIFRIHFPDGLFVRHRYQSYFVDDQLKLQSLESDCKTLQSGVVIQ
jgi:hypothetical protein